MAKVAKQEHGGDVVVLGLENDGTLLTSTLSAAFPGARTLSYWTGGQIVELRVLGGSSIEMPSGFSSKTVFIPVFGEDVDFKRFHSFVFPLHVATNPAIGNEEVHGTCFALSDEWLVTAGHCVTHGTYLHKSTSPIDDVTVIISGTHVGVAEIQLDATIDVAVMRLKEKLKDGPDPIVPSTPQLEEEVLCMGYAGSVFYTSLCRAGVFKSAVSHAYVFETENVVPFQFSTSPGAEDGLSGGPVLSRAGKLLGVMTGITRPSYGTCSTICVFGRKALQLFQKASCEITHDSGSDGRELFSSSTDRKRHASWSECSSLSKITKLS